MSRSQLMAGFTSEVGGPRLFASAPHPLPFAAALDIRAFLLQREGGNLLVYSAPTVERDRGAVEDLGGASSQYLNHWHEAGFGCAGAARALGADVICHAADAEAVEAQCAVSRTFARRTRLGGDLELIPIPGHTPGATAYLWDSEEHRCLFTGDSVYLREGEWVAAVLAGSSDRRAYIDSLELLRELDFDLLVPWAATRGQPAWAFTDRADARRRIDAILKRLRRGEDH